MSFAAGLMRKTGAAMLVAAGQVLHAAHRPDLPGLQNQDPSGTFGDPSNPPLLVIALGDSSITAPGVVPLDASWIRQAAPARAINLTRRRGRAHPPLPWAGRWLGQNVPPAVRSAAGDGSYESRKRL